MSKRFLHLSFSFFLISFGIMLLSFSSYKPVKSATTNYNYQWNMSKCRTVAYDAANQNVREIFLGPAEWKTTPFFVPGGNEQISETWSVISWNESHTYPDGLTTGGPQDPNTYNVYNSRGNGNVPITDPNCDRTLVKFDPGDAHTHFFTLGAYGAGISWTPGNGFWHFDATSSIPTDWEINGTITTP